MKIISVLFYVVFYCDVLITVFFLMKQTMVLSLNKFFVNTAKQLKSAVSSYEIKKLCFLSHSSRFCKL